MAVTGGKLIDLPDLYLRAGGLTSGVNAAELVLINILSKMSPELHDAYAQPCNSKDGLSYNYSVLSKLPDVTWGRIYKGIPTSKSARTLQSETTGWIEQASEVEERIVEISDNGAQVRMDEAMTFLQAMAIKAAESVWYSNSDLHSDQIMGLSPRYSDLSSKQAKNIIDAGGTGNDNTSIWFVNWGRTQVSMVYPRNLPAGMQRKDRGKIPTQDENGDTYFVYREEFTWHLGIAVADWRQAVRICNIDVSDLKAGTVNLQKLLRKAFYAMPALGYGLNSNTIIYMNRDVDEALDAETTNSTSSDNYVRLTPETVQGAFIHSWRGIPIRITDTLLVTESQVT